MGPVDCQEGSYTKDWGETEDLREAGDLARETGKMGPNTEDWGKTGDIREARDWTRETARMGPILKTVERLEI